MNEEKVKQKTKKQKQSNKAGTVELLTILRNIIECYAKQIDCVTGI